MNPKVAQAVINRHIVFPLIERLRGMITYPDVVAPSGTWRVQVNAFFEITHYKRIDVDPWTLKPLGDK